MPLAAIGLGSNLSSEIGGPEATLVEAVRRLREVGRVEAVSAWIETDPVEVVDQPRFINGALLLRTGLKPTELLHALLGIERELGRVRDGVPRRGPRTADLDLLLYDDMVLNTEELTVPHPLMHQREFVLRPLAEIGPELRHTVLGKTVRELWEAWQARGGELRVAGWDG